MSGAHGDGYSVSQPSLFKCIQIFPFAEIFETFLGDQEQNSLISEEKDGN